MAKDFNRTYEELSRREQCQVNEALDRLQLRIEQGSSKYGSWAGALVLPLKPKCKCEDDETVIVSVQIETRVSKVDGSEYVVGDFMLRTGREAMGAPSAYVVDIPFEYERAFLGEAAARVVDLTWSAVAAVVPALAEVVKPDRAEVDAQSFGRYAQRPGSNLPIRLM